MIAPSPPGKFKDGGVHPPKVLGGCHPPLLPPLPQGSVQLILPLRSAPMCTYDGHTHLYNKIFLYLYGLCYIYDAISSMIFFYIIGLLLRSSSSCVFILYFYQQQSSCISHFVTMSVMKFWLWSFIISTLSRKFMLMGQKNFWPPTVASKCFEYQFLATLYERG